MNADPDHRRQRHVSSLEHGAGATSSGGAKAKDVNPPLGTVFNDPIRSWHNQQPSLGAPADITVRIYHRAIYNQLLVRLGDNQSDRQVIAWAKDELCGFIRS